MNPKVTIGVCVKNSEKTIEGTIESVVNQDFPHELIELMIVDGQSKDGTLTIIEEMMSKSDIKTTFLSENSGLGFARQMVVENANGDYIIWVDGDLMLSRDHVRKQFEFMESHPDVGIAKAQYELRDGTNLVDLLENLNFVLLFWDEGNTTAKTLGTSGCTYRVKAIREVNGFDINIKGVGEDMDAEHRVRSAGWLLSITSATFYEQHRSSWNSLWREYYWHGFGGRYLFKKNMKMLNVHKMLPPIAVLVEFLRVPRMYELTHKKRVFLFPLHYTFKRVAWFCGFVNAWLNGYGQK